MPRRICGRGTQQQKVIMGSKKLDAKSQFFLNPDSFHISFRCGIHLYATHNNLQNHEDPCSQFHVIKERGMKLQCQFIVLIYIVLSQRKEMIKPFR